MASRVLPPEPRTPPPQSRPTELHPSSPVKPVASHFAEHKRDEVQAFGYKEEIHQLERFSTREEFLDFLGIDIPENVSEEDNTFSLKTFVLAANTLSESLRDDCESFLSS
jgi:hypothetical protein